MLNLPETVALPLKMDDGGNIRVSGTRVTLHTLINAYLQNPDADAIHNAFPTVPLADVHAVISYYLANREAVDAHMRHIDAEGDRWREFWESRYTPEQKARTEEFRRLLEEKRKERES